jgi:hypothetical protein
MDVDKARNHLPAIRAPLGLLYIVLLRFYAMGICILVLCGRFWVDRTWPSPFKFWLCITFGVVATVHILFGRSVRPRSPEPVRLTISPLATLGIIGMVIVVGLFSAWIIID